MGKGYVEACPKGIDKGVMAERFVGLVADAARRGRPAEPLQFVLCVGDDSSDELMFEALHSKFGMHPADLDLFTVTVGRKPSKAQVYLGDHTEVVELLKMLSSIGSAKQRKFASMGDLVKLDISESGPGSSSHNPMAQSTPAMMNVSPRRGSARNSAGDPYDDGYVAGGGGSGGGAGILASSGAGRQRPAGQMGARTTSFFN